MHPDPQRVVQLFSSDGTHTRVGSGYLVRPGLVLTAAHVVKGAGTCRVVVGIPEAATYELPSRDVALRDDAAGIAVLSLGDGAAAVDACPMGRLARRAGAVQARALGFPRFKVRDPKQPAPYRESHVATGAIDPLSNTRGDTLEFRTSSAPSAVDDAKESVWAGMSGAAVWVADRLVGVVAEHHPSEGTSMLSCAPLSAVADVAVAAALGLPAQRNELPDLAVPDPHEQVLELHRLECLAKCPRDASGRARVQHRDAELAALADFSRGPQRLLWIQGPAWAGKTALVAAFAVDPPLGVAALAVFVGPTTPGEVFLDICISRLGAFLRRPVGGLATVTEKEAMFRLLLAAATASGTFVLLVDGLDEDPLLPGAPAIAELLCFAPDDAVKLVVTSRPGRASIAAGHPLATAPGRMQLTPSPEAQELATRARAELDGVLRDPPPMLDDLLGLLATTGGMTAAELAELCQPALTPGRVRLLLDARVGRLFTSIATADGHRYAYGHAELRRAAREFFGTHALRAFAERVDAWVDGYAARGWPQDTPAFCFDRYVDLLRERGEVHRLAAIVPDRRRRERLLAQTGSHVALAGEIASAQDALAASRTPDVAGATRLAITGFAIRDHLAETAEPETVAFFVRSGQRRRAIETLATMSPDDSRFAAATARVYAELYTLGDANAAEEILLAVDDERRPRVGALAAASLARDRPDVATRLIGDARRADTELLEGLAAHDGFVDVAIGLARDDGPATLAVARALAARQPERALALCDGLDGWAEWSAGSKPWRDRSFARVEVARVVASDELALGVLREELDRGDGAAALVAAAMRLTAPDPAAVPALVDAAADPNAATVALAHVAAMAARGRDAPLSGDRLAAVLWWKAVDLDVVERFGAVLAAAPLAFGGLLRTLVDDDGRTAVRYLYVGRAEQPAGAVATIAGELASIGALADDDIARLAEAFGIDEIGHDASARIFAKAARRTASADSARAVAFAGQAGSTQSWVLRDVVATVAANDLEAALEIIDGVEREHTATRSMLVGAAGALVDPARDPGAVAELSRRLPEPQDGAAVTHGLANCALRLGGLASVLDTRAEQLAHRLRSAAPRPAHDQYLADRAVALAPSLPADALRAVVSIDVTTGYGAQIATRAAVEIAGDLPPDGASRLLERCAGARLTPSLLELALTALVRLDPRRAGLIALNADLAPERLARIFAAALAGPEPGPARDALLRVLLLEGLEPDGNRLFAGAWAFDCAGGGAACVPTAFAERRRAIAAGDVPAIEHLLRDDGAALDDALAMMVCESLARARAAIQAAITARRADALLYGVRGRRVRRLLAIVAAADPNAALDLVGELDWPAFCELSGVQGARDAALADAVAQLARTDWHRALATSTAIAGGHSLRQALAEIAARIPHEWPADDRCEALRQVMAEARRVDDPDLFNDDLLDALRREGAVDRRMQTQLLTATARWPTGKVIWQLGEAVALVAADPGAVAEAFEGLLAALADLGR